MFKNNYLRFSAGYLLVFLITVLFSVSLMDAQAVDRCLVSPKVRNAIIQEFSGEGAFQHIMRLGGFSVDRKSDEYEKTFFEAQYVLDRAKEYGFTDAHIEYFDSGEMWDAEDGELWMIEPEEKIISRLRDIPASLARNSKNADVTAELVYVPNGANPRSYENIDVSGKIVLAYGRAGSVHDLAVLRYGALGVIVSGSAASMSDYVYVDPNQIGWQRIQSSASSTFAFVLSEKQFNDLRKILERGINIKMRAKVKSTWYPYKQNVVTAIIPGTEKVNEELIYVAHLFEMVSVLGANDNASGCAVTLEIGRTLIKLIEEGKLVPPKRTLRFLWVPEISGTRRYIAAHPELADKALVALNFDMVSEDLEKCDTHLRMKSPPDSRPSYLLDLMKNLLEFIDRSDIRTQTGNNAPFNYRLVPFISGSDHIVFINSDVGISAMQFNHYTDNFYHSSADRPDKSDPTESKRVGIIAASAFHYLSTAGEKEALNLAWDVVNNGIGRMSEITRQAIRIIGNNEESAYAGYKEAMNKVECTYKREKAAIYSVFELSDTKKVQNFTDELVKQLMQQKIIEKGKVEAFYKLWCRENNILPREITVTEVEKRAGQLIPEILLKSFSDEYNTAMAKMRRDYGSKMRLARLPVFEVWNFIDGKRSILDIANAVSAEYSGVYQGRELIARKFAYEVDPATKIIPLKDVSDYLEAMEAVGIINIKKK